MTRDEARPVDVELFAHQLRKYVLEPLTSPGLVEAVKAAAQALNELGAVAERRPRPPRITADLHQLHRRNRRRP